MELLKFVNAKAFLPEYCDIPYNSWTKNKMRGLDNTGKPLTFSDDDKRKIRAGLKKIAREADKLLK